jgi:hypothetical protein
VTARRRPSPNQFSLYRLRITSHVVRLYCCGHTGHARDIQLSWILSLSINAPPKCVPPDVLPRMATVKRGDCTPQRNSLHMGAMSVTPFRKVMSVSTIRSFWFVWFLWLIGVQPEPRCHELQKRTNKIKPNERPIASRCVRQSSCDEKETHHSILNITHLTPDASRASGKESSMLSRLALGFVLFAISLSLLVPQS